MLKTVVKKGSYQDSGVLMLLTNATNVVTAIADANMDSVPMVVITPSAR